VDKADSRFVYRNLAEFHNYAPYNQVFWSNWYPLSWGEKVIQGVQHIQIHYFENNANPFHDIRVIEFPVQESELPPLRVWICGEIMKQFLKKQ
jgi:hypothetical protein